MKSLHNVWPIGNLEFCFRYPAKANYGGYCEGDRVLFASGPPAIRARLRLRVYKYSNKPGCINSEDTSLQPMEDDYLKPDAPRQ